MSVLVNMLHSSSIIVYVFLRWLNLNISRFRCHLVVSFFFFLLSRTVGELHYIVTVKLFPNFESCNYNIEVT